MLLSSSPPCFLARTNSILGHDVRDIFSITFFYADWRKEDIQVVVMMMIVLNTDDVHL